MSAAQDIKFNNLMDEAKRHYSEGDYIMAWTLVGAAQRVIGEKQEQEDKANGKAASYRID